MLSATFLPEAYFPDFIVALNTLICFQVEAGASIVVVVVSFIIIILFSISFSELFLYLALSIMWPVLSICHYRLRTFSDRRVGDQN